MRANTTTIAGVLLLGTGAMLLGGCYTIEGAGRDTAALGAGTAAMAKETREYGAEIPGPGDERQRQAQPRH